MKQGRQGAEVRQALQGSPKANLQSARCCMAEAFAVAAGLGCAWLRMRREPWLLRESRIPALVGASLLATRRAGAKLALRSPASRLLHRARAEDEAEAGSVRFASAGAPSHESPPAIPASNFLASTPP